MPESEDDLTSRVRRLLARIRGVEEKKMFGGIAFMVRGKMCLAVRKERMMCRIDPKIYDAALRHKHCRPVVMKGRQYRGYVYIDADYLKTRTELAYWVGLTLDYNKRARASAARRKKPARRTR